MKSCKKENRCVENDDLIIARANILLLPTDEDDYVCKYINRSSEELNSGLIAKDNNKPKLCYLHSQIYDGGNISDSNTNSSGINIVRRWQQKSQGCSLLVRSLSDGVKREHRVVHLETKVGTNQSSNNYWDDFALKSLTLHKVKSFSDSNIFLHTARTIDSSKIRANKCDKLKDCVKERLTHDDKQKTKIRSNMEVLLPSKKADVYSAKKQQISTSTTQKHVTEGKTNLQDEKDLELVVLEGGDSEDNKVEEMICLPPTQSLVDSSATVLLTSSSSSSTSGSNCITCRLRCQQEGDLHRHIEHPSRNIGIFNQTNNVSADHSVICNNKKDNTIINKNEGNEQYFLVNEETSAAAASGGDVDEGCYLSILTPTRTTTEKYYTTCKMNITGANMFTSSASANMFTSSRQVITDDRVSNMIDETVINVGGDNRHGCSSSTSSPNGTNVANDTTRSSFSERCSSSDVDSGRVSDTDTGTTSSTNSSNHQLGEEQKYANCFIQASERCLRTPTNSQSVHIVSNEVQTADFKEGNYKSFTNDNTKAEENEPPKLSTNPKSTQMVHIVPHSFCDFLGTLPGAKSRSNTTKNTKDSEGAAQGFVCDNLMSEDQKSKTHNCLIHNNPTSKNIGLSEGDEMLLLHNDNDHSIISQDCQHNQNKVTVFVPYSTIVRCMNETIDRKRRNNKQVVQKDEENDDQRGERQEREEEAIKLHKVSKREIILINDDSADDRQNTLTSTKVDSLTHDENNEHTTKLSHSMGRASCVGIVVGGGEVGLVDDADGKTVYPVVNGQQHMNHHQNRIAYDATENNNKLYSKRMTKRLQQYKSHTEQPVPHLDKNTSKNSKDEESSRVNPCMLMLTEDSEELILPSPPPFPTSTSTTPTPNYDEIIRNELLQDSEDFLNQIRKTKSGQDKGGNEASRNFPGIPRRKDLCKLLGLNERNVGDLLIVPDEKVKLAQKVALMHKCNISPITMPDYQSKETQKNALEDVSSCEKSLRQICLTDDTNANIEKYNHNKCTFGGINTEGIEKRDQTSVNSCITNGSVARGGTSATYNENSNNTAHIVPQRKKSKNLAKFFGIEDELTANEQLAPNTKNASPSENEQAIFIDPSHPVDLPSMYDDYPNIVMRRKKKREEKPSESRFNCVNKVDIVEHSKDSLAALSNKQIHTDSNTVRPRSLLVSWNNLLKRSSVRWRSSNGIIRGGGARGGVLGGIQKTNENYSYADDSDAYSSSDDEILQELQVPVQLRQMGDPSFYHMSHGKGQDRNEEENKLLGLSASGPKRKDLSRFLGLDDSDSEEIVFIQNNKLPRQKPVVPSSNNDTFSSFGSFSKQSQNSSVVHSYITNIESSHVPQTEVDGNSVQVTEPSISCNNDTGNSSSTTNTGSTSMASHPTCHLPLRNPILDMLENDMENFNPPPRKSVVFKDYGLFSVEESIARGLPIIPFDSVNISRDGKISEKKKNQSGIGQRKRKKDADRRTSEILIDTNHVVQKVQKNSRARSTSSESSLQALFRNHKSGFDDENADHPDNLNNNSYWEASQHYSILGRENSENITSNMDHIGTSIHSQVNGKHPKRNETCKDIELKTLDRKPDGGAEHLESSLDGSGLRSNQLPVRSALRSPNSPPKRPCGPVVFGANSRRTISPIRKTQHKTGVALAYVPQHYNSVAQPMVPAVYYHGHRLPVIFYGHHHPNIGYISHPEPTNSNFCRAFTRQPLSKISSPTANERTCANNTTSGVKYNYNARSPSKKGINESKSISNGINAMSGHKSNGNIQRCVNGGNRLNAGGCVSSKPPRQRQMISNPNDHSCAPPSEPNNSPDFSGTYVIMKNGLSKKSAPSSVSNCYETNGLNLKL